MITTFRRFETVLIASVASVLLLQSAAVRAAIPPAENLLPPDTIAFFTVPDCNALRAVSKVSPQLMFWNDPAMKPFRDKVVEHLNEKFIAPLEKDLGLKVDDFTSLLQGQFTVAATANGTSGRDDVPPGLVLLLDARDKAPQLKTNLAALTKKITDQGRTLRTEKIRGLDFSIVTLSSNDLANVFGPRRQVSEIGVEQKPEPPVDIYFTQYESLLVVANSPKLAEAVAAHLTGGTTPALAEDDGFVADKQSQFRNTPTYYGWFNGRLFFNLVGAAPTSAQPRSMMPPPDKILEVLGLRNLKSASFALNESYEGSTATLHITAPAAERAGLLKILSLPAKDASAPMFVPADVVKFSRYRIDGRQAWNDLEKMLANLSPQMLAGVNSAIDLANTSAQQKDPSFDLRKNLIANLGDDIINYAKAPVGDTIADINKQPSIVLIATPNPDQMIQAIRVIGSLAAPQDSAAPREFRGHKIYSIAQRSQRGPNGAVTPAPLLVSSGSGYLALSADAGILEEFLRNGDGSAKPLRENAAIAEAAAHIGGMGTGLFTYQNQRETMRTSFKIFKTAAGDEMAMKLIAPAVREWFDFALLPDYDRVAKYFGISVLNGGSAGDGLLLKFYTPRPPGLE